MRTAQQICYFSGESAPTHSRHPCHASFYPSKNCTNLKKKIPQSLRSLGGPPAPQQTCPLSHSARHRRSPQHIHSANRSLFCAVISSSHGYALTAPTTAVALSRAPGVRTFFVRAAAIVNVPVMPASVRRRVVVPVAFLTAAAAGCASSAATGGNVLGTALCWPRLAKEVLCGVELDQTLARLASPWWFRGRIGGAASG